MSYFVPDSRFEIPSLLTPGRTLDLHAAGTRPPILAGKPFGVEVKIDPTHWAARGMTAYFMRGSGLKLFNLVDVQQYLTLAGTNPATLHPDGSISCDFPDADYALAQTGEQFGLGGATGATMMGGFRSPGYASVKFVAGLQNSAATNRYSFAFACYSNDLSNAIFCTEDSSNRSWLEHPESTFVAYDYYYITIRFNGAGATVSDRLTLFKNGLPVTNDGSSVTGTGGQNLASGGRFSLARDEGDTGRTAWGHYSDWKIWNRALSDAEILSLYRDKYQFLIPA